MLPRCTLFKDLLPHIISIPYVNTGNVTPVLQCEISGFHGGEYDGSLLGYIAVQSRCSPTFQRCVRPPSSGWSPCILPLSSWWWRQYAPLKRRSTPTRLHGAVSQKTAIFPILHICASSCCLVPTVVNHYEFRVASDDITSVPSFIKIRRAVVDLKLDDSWTDRQEPCVVHFVHVLQWLEL
jgi:hypothetical protein